MEREFIEYYSENGRIPYSASTLCFCLTGYAKNYVLENRKATSNIDKNVKDAVLVDAINYLGAQGGCDFALYTEGLYNEREIKEKVDSQCLLTVIVNRYTHYMFKEGIVESVLRNNHMNECTEEFSFDDGATILIDFINYIAEKNGYCRKFTIVELYERFKTHQKEKEMKKLKQFLELTREYSEKLLLGQSIDTIFESMSRKHRLKYIAEDGTYHYTDRVAKRLGHSKMPSWVVNEVEKHIYAMTYAYAKISEVYDMKPSQNEVINQKIIEMRQK